VNDREMLVIARRINELAAEGERWRRWREEERQEGNRLLKAMRIARTVDDGEALLRGKDVPAERLDPRWLRAYGIRQP